MFRLYTIRTRDGLVTTMTSPAGNSAITGLAGLNYIDAVTAQIPVAFDYAGQLSRESPVGGGAMIPIVGDIVTLPAKARMRAAAAFNRLYMAFGDGKVGLSNPAVLDGASLRLEPISGRVVGEAWTAGATDIFGEIITPTVANGHMYQCTVAGVSGAAEPVWPLTVGGVIADGTAQWTEVTPQLVEKLVDPSAPVLTRVGAAGTWAANRDVYIIVTLVNNQGETDAAVGKATVLVNTVLNDRIQVPAPALVSWENLLEAAYVATGYNVYTADVATGGAAPVIGSYKKLAGGPFALNAVTNVDAAAGGAAPPTVSTAWVVPVGNICAGVRDAYVFFENHNGYQTGFGQNAVITYTASGGREVRLVNAYYGPSNTQRRVVAFNVAADPAVGPLFYIPQDDVFEGVSQTRTTIEDNATSHALFNFDDDYLATGIDVTQYFNKLRVPQCADVVYDSTLNRMIYCGISGAEFYFYLSQPNDPETVNAITGRLAVAQGDGYGRCVTWRENQGNHFAFKERAAYAVANEGADPRQWRVDLLWRNSGPSGPDAIDVGHTFFAYAHRSGGYVWKGNGEPLLITAEIEKIWKRINWKAGERVKVDIDDDNYYVYFYVPLDNATECSHRLTLYWGVGLEDPYIRTLNGDIVPNHAGRRWSIDDVPCGAIATVERTLPKTIITNGLPDNLTSMRQLLVGSPNPDGNIAMTVPGYHQDNGNAIDWVYETGTFRDAGRATQFGGGLFEAQGKGQLYLDIIRSDGKVIPIKNKLELTDAMRLLEFGAEFEASEFRLRISNHKTDDYWAEIGPATFMTRRTAMGGMS